MSFQQKYSEEIHILRRIAIIAAILLIMTLLHYSTLINESDPAVFSITLLGLMLVLSYNLGKVLSRLKLPKLTIYLVTGILCGPYVASYVSVEVIGNLKFVDSLALSLISFIAGGEMRLNELRRLRGVLARITLFETTSVFIWCSLAFVVLSPLIPLARDKDWVFIAMVACILASILVANSPAVTIGLIGEYRTQGPLTETVLGTVVIKDIVVIILFSTVCTAAAAALVPGTSWDPVNLVRMLAYEIMVSIALGVAIGLIVWAYMRFVAEQTVLFVIGAAFMVHELAVYYHLEVLLVGVTAGFFVQNFTRQGRRLIEHLEESLPVVYPVFFSIAGAKLNLLSLKELWYVAVAFFLIRMWAIKKGASYGARTAGAPAIVTRHAWKGLISQAGVALGLVVLAQKAFPQWGADLQTLVVPVIGLNELIGPLFFKYALDKAGEMPAYQPDVLINLSLQDDIPSYSSSPEAVGSKPPDDAETKG